MPEKLAELHGSVGAMSRPRGSRCGIGRPSSAAGTTIESMHHGQRDAARGNCRLQERQTRLDRDIVMSRSIGAARRRRGNEPHRRWQCRSRALHAGFWVGLSAPTMDSACPDKPRNPDERLSAHGDVLPACLSGRCAFARGLFPSDYQECDDHHAEKACGHDRPCDPIHFVLLHWNRAARRSLSACAEIRVSCVEVSMFEGTRPATTRGMSFREMPMSSNCRSSRRWSAAAAWLRCQRFAAREMRSATVARKPVRRDDTGWVPDSLNSNMIAAPFTMLIEPRAQECKGGAHRNGCVPGRSAPSRYALIVILEAPRRRTRAFEPLGARSGSGMAPGKQTSCSFGRNSTYQIYNQF